MSGAKTLSRGIKYFFVNFRFNLNLSLGFPLSEQNGKEVFFNIFLIKYPIEFECRKEISIENPSTRMDFLRTPTVSHFPYSPADLVIRLSTNFLLRVL